jgi:hypothetical protein
MEHDGAGDASGGERAHVGGRIDDVGTEAAEERWEGDLLPPVAGGMAGGVGGGVDEV